MSERVSGVGKWWRSLRTYSFPASIMPVALAAAYAAPQSPVLWILPIFLFAAVLFHAGTNVLNDYYDYKHGIDGPDDHDPTHTITQGVTTPRFMQVTGHLYFIAGIVLGSVLALFRGPLFLAFGLVGAAGAYFYTGARFSLKYRALGDVAVFILMGPALVMLGVWALTGEPSVTAGLIALPQAFLVTAILHGNNLRDRESDARAGVTTIAGLIGDKASRFGLLALFLLALISQIVLWLTGLVPALSLVAIAAAVPAVFVTRTVFRAESSSQLIALPGWCAGVHLLHGVLYAVGVFLGG